MDYSKEAILKEYCKYCKDRGIDYKKTKSKNDFKTDYILLDVKLNGIKNLKEKQQKIIDTLKYNSLTIKNIYENL